MKRYPRLVQADKRGQIVIPKDVRKELNIDENTGFYIYVIPGEGMLLKQMEPPNLKGHNITEELKRNSKELGIDKKSVDGTADRYSKKGGLEEL